MGLANFVKLNFRPKVYAELQRTGMCNRLFIWAHAYVFSYKHKMPLFVIGWYKTQIGPWIRKEKKKRIYLNYFAFHSDITGFVLRKNFLRRGVRINPALNSELNLANYHTFIFNHLPDSRDYFGDLKVFREIIIEALNKMILASFREKINKREKPQIGVHVRRGDFVTNGQAEKLDYFIGAINYLRSTYGSDLKVTIFSDGYGHELKELTQLPETILHKGESDIEDLMLLSKSDFIITSIHSTFSYWAAFLSKALVIHNTSYAGQPIRNIKFSIHGDYLIETGVN